MSRVTLEASSTVASALLMSLVIGSALAQEALPTIDVAAQSSDEGGRGKERRPIIGPLGPAPAEAKSLKQITQTISVVDRQQIELTNPTGLLEILAQAPGVAIARAGGIGGQIYLRGFSSNTMRSPLYVDGDRLHGRNTLQLNYFAPEEIEQVEVIRGPASVLYGSDASPASSMSSRGSLPAMSMGRSVSDAAARHSVTQARRRRSAHMNGPRAQATDSR